MNIKNVSIIALTIRLNLIISLKLTIYVIYIYIYIYIYENSIRFHLDSQFCVTCLVGYENLDKNTCATCHDQCQGAHHHAKEATRSDSKAMSVAQCQRRSCYWEKTLERRSALMWLEGWWLPPHSMRLTKSPSCIYVEKTPEQYCLDRCNSQEVLGSVWWDKHSSGKLSNQQMEGWDCLKGAI